MNQFFPISKVTVGAHTQWHPLLLSHDRLVSAEAMPDLSVSCWASLLPKACTLVPLFDRDLLGLQLEGTGTQGENKSSRLSSANFSPHMVGPWAVVTAELAGKEWSLLYKGTGWGSGREV